MGELAKFLFGDDEEPKKKSSKASKSRSGGRIKQSPQKSKTVARQATNRPVGTKKGSAMPVRTAADLERELSDRKKKKGDVEDQALEYYKLWRRMRSEDDKSDVIEMLKSDKAFKQIKNYLPQEMLDALGSDSKNGGKLDPELVKKAQKYKDGGKSNIKALTKLVDDGADEAAAEAVVDSVYKKKGK